MQHRHLVITEEADFLFQPRRLLAVGGDQQHRALPLPDGLRQRQPHARAGQGRPGLAVLGAGGQGGEGGQQGVIHGEIPAASVRHFVAGDCNGFDGGRKRTASSRFH